MGKPKSFFELSLVSVSYWNKTRDNIILSVLPKINPVKWCSQFQEFVRFGGNICLRTSSILPTPVKFQCKSIYNLTPYLLLKAPARTRTFDYCFHCFSENTAFNCGLLNTSLCKCVEYAYQYVKFGSHCA